MSTFWRDRAACLDVDPELHFPVGHSPAAQRQTEEAKAVCRGCPVVEQCLTWALDAGVSGVWGGLSEDERRALRQRTQRAEAKARDRAGEGVTRPREYPVRAATPGLRIGRPS